MVDNSQTEEKLAAALLTKNLSDILARAEDGDVLAAHDALADLAFCLSTSRKNPWTDEILPVPDCVREYLSRSLQRMAKGENASKAMNLKKAGPKKWGYFERRLAADVVFRLVEGGATVLEAVMAAAEFIEIYANESSASSAWFAFKGRSIESETLQTWYYKFKDELTELRQKLADL